MQEAEGRRVERVVERVGLVAVDGGTLAHCSVIGKASTAEAQGQQVLAGSSRSKQQALHGLEEQLAQRRRRSRTCPPRTIARACVRYDALFQKLSVLCGIASRSPRRLLFRAAR
eukprot:scaffold2963_cov250-Pinguiococcus_pyrenoidosus.AAC.19